jgi:uncharacterized protein (DUF2141 family)
VHALDENWELLWSKEVFEETSGITGCTLFDFNGDGKTEIVYRDEDYLYILNGDGTVGDEIKCRSRTNIEYPIVADVDADGSTEICVVCTPDSYEPTWPGRWLDLDDPAQVRIYESGGEPWVPARRVWNQHGYFNVNINDDLTVPRRQQKHHLVWSNGTCQPGPVRPLNGFLNQSPFLSSEGCPTYASPDLAIIENTFTINQPTCPDTDFTVSFNFENIGDVPLSGDVPITFYDGDPLVAGTNRLNTEYLSLTNFAVGQVDSAIDINISGSGSAFTLYAVLNDDGATTPAPITFPSTNFLECDYFNNIVAADVNPAPFTLSAEITNNFACVDSLFANGTARVFRDVGGSEVTTNYDFFWFDGTDTSGTPDFEGITYTGLAPGTYSVYATHNIAGCSSDTLRIQIADSSTTRDLVATINLDQAVTNCKNPNGKLTVTVNGGDNDPNSADPPGKYDYVWFEGSQVFTGDTIAVSHTVTTLSAGFYSVRIIEKATGCTVTQSAQVPDNTVSPDITLDATDIVCSALNSGSVSVSVTGGNSGHKFDWFEGTSIKPSADYTGAEVTGLAEGWYTVVVTDNSSKCTTTDSIRINQTTAPEIESVSGTNNISCDNSQPNGSVSATIVGDINDHTVEWFAGASTTGSPIGTGLNLNNLSGGVYTVKLTIDSTGCFVTDQVNIINDIVQPNVSLTAQPITQCSPFNGSVTASVDLDDLNDYTFLWYDGQQVKASPDYTENGNVLDDLAPGFYTVEAFHNARNCFDIQTIEVADSATVNIEQDKAILDTPSTCAERNGILQVEVSSPNNTSGFFIEWYKGNSSSGSPFLTEDGVFISRADSLLTGLYTVTATDLDNGCTSQEVLYLPFDEAHKIDTVLIENATTCIPNNGSIEVIGLDPAPGTTANQYLAILQIQNGAVYDSVTTLRGNTNPLIFENLEKGIYIVQIYSEVSECSIYEIDIEIELEVEDPVISGVTRQPNTNCISSTANGSITIEVDQGSIDLNDYVINWYSGTTVDPLNQLAFAGLTADSLMAGDYTVEVINDSSQCSVVETYSIIDNITTVSIASADLQLTPVTLCGDPGNGTATIINVNENGSPANMADYTFEWFEESDTANPIQSGTTNTWSDLREGIYYVIATNTATGCASSLTEFVIERDIDEPVLSLDFDNPQLCAVQPGAGGGRLEVTVSGLSGPYSIAWFEGTGTTNQIGTTNAGPSNEITDLTEGSYTVRVMDSTSSCTYEETYQLVTEVNQVQITTSATPVTNCDSDNGSVFATVTSDGGYSYEWRTLSGTFVAESRRVENLSAGDYIIIATDTITAACTARDTITIANEQVIPNIQVNQVDPLTVCDLSLANGVASASVDGEIVGYTFEWFEGNSATGDIVYTGPEFAEMQDIAYTVRATDNITQCSNEATITITSDVIATSAPTIEVLSHDTHCQLDNGSLRVDVNGSTGRYIFNWYVGEEVGATTFAVGERVTNLSAGIYTVTATDTRTGCISEPVSAEIIEDLEYPDFEFEVQGVSCNESNGYVALLITSAIEINTIEWTNSAGIRVGTGPSLTNVPADTYTASVESSMGCSAEKEVTVPTEINAFNGISRNGDSRNNSFKIDCISNFPNNLVKIYNRAGTLVYEAKGYDNNTVVFDGVSNKGLNLMGTNVPDGTYFYVIDKGNGSKPVTGYLEIVN